MIIAGGIAAEFLQFHYDRTRALFVIKYRILPPTATSSCMAPLSRIVYFVQTRVYACGYNGVVVALVFAVDFRPSAISQNNI